MLTGSCLVDLLSLDPWKHFLETLHPVDEPLGIKLLLLGKLVDVLIQLCLVVVCVVDLELKLEAVADPWPGLRCLLGVIFLELFENLLSKLFEACLLGCLIR